MKSVRTRVATPFPQPVAGRGRPLPFARAALRWLTATVALSATAPVAAVGMSEWWNALTESDPTRETAVVLSGASYHFRQDERNWRQVNPGIGIEQTTRIDGLYRVAGYFRNSYDRHTAYAGARWMPWQLGPVSFGGYLLAATGYPSPVLVLPGLSVAVTKRFGVNLVVTPNLGAYSGYVGVQVSVR